MRRSRIASGFVLAASLLLTALGIAPAQSQPNATTLYEGARVIVGDGSVIENGAFLVTNG